MTEKTITCANGTCRCACHLTEVRKPGHICNPLGTGDVLEAGESA